MKLTLETLKTAGAFTGRPVEKEISWKQDDQVFVATVYVRPLGYQAAISEVLSVGGGYDNMAGRIAASICDENGVAVFTVDDIVKGPIDPVALAADPKTTQRLGPLHGGLTVALLAAIHQVNSLGKTKSSPNSMSSGTNSSSRASAAKRSPKPKKT
jgi:hypothetical protein